MDSSNKIVLTLLLITSFLLDRWERNAWSVEAFNGTYIDAPHDAEIQWVASRDCNTRGEKKWKTLRWASAKDLGEVDKGMIAGIYLKHHNVIIIREDVLELPPWHLMRQTVIRHEIMHARDGYGGHDPKYFNERCGTSNEWAH